MENAEALAHFESIATAQVLPTDGGPPLSGVDASDQFLPDATDSDAQLRALNAAFLLGLGDPSPLRTEARKLLQRVARGSAGSTTRSTSSSAHLAPRRPRRSKHRRPHVPSSRGVGSRGSRGEDLNVRDRGGVGRASSEPRCRPLS